MLVRHARIKLLAAIYLVAYWRGEAQWKNGYRCGKQGRLSAVDAEKYQKHEAALWIRVDECEKSVTRAIAAYTRAVRTQAVSKDGRSRLRGKQIHARSAGKTRKTRSSVAQEEQE